MPRNRCAPQEGVTSLHGCVHRVESRPCAPPSACGHTRRDSTCRPREWRAASGADDTRDGRDAWPAWGAGSGGLVMRGARAAGGLLLGDDTAPCGKAAEDTGGQAARWRRAYRVLCDGRSLATAGAPGTAHNPGALRKPALWRGAHTAAVDLEGRRPRTVTLRARHPPHGRHGVGGCCVVPPVST